MMTDSQESKSWLTESSLLWLTGLLNERFGIDFKLSFVDCEFVEIKINDFDGFVRIVVDSKYFTRNDSEIPFQTWNCVQDGWEGSISNFIPSPGCEYLPSPLILKSSNGFLIKYDILGLIYWMLTRQEEIGRTDLDVHHRFPATASHAYRHNYLERPIVDEWLCILAQVFLRVWPTVRFQELSFSIKVSHDVDNPSQYAFKPWSNIARIMAGHLLKRHDFVEFLKTPCLKIKTKKTLRPDDSLNTFDWLMDQSEARGLKSAFYFICGHTSPSNDADYDISHPVIRDLMRRIHQRGHEIGLHPSYGTYQQPQILLQEAQYLRRVMAEENIVQENIGGRMHYLRWEQPVTMQAWNDAELIYDSSLSYADRPGFRAGTCFEYAAFNPITQKILSLRIRPLIAMECSVISSKYLGLGVGHQATNKFLELKDKCRKVKGCFTLLWHNSYFNSLELKEMYKNILD